MSLGDLPQVPCKCAPWWQCQGRRQASLKWHIIVLTQVYQHGRVAREWVMGREEAGAILAALSRNRCDCEIAWAFGCLTVGGVYVPALVHVGVRACWCACDCAGAGAPRHAPAVARQCFLTVLVPVCWILSWSNVHLQPTLVLFQHVSASMRIPESRARRSRLQSTCVNHPAPPHRPGTTISRLLRKAGGPGGGVASPPSGSDKRLGEAIFKGHGSYELMLNLQVRVAEWVTD